MPDAQRLPPRASSVAPELLLECLPQSGTAGVTVAGGSKPIEGGAGSDIQFDGQVVVHNPATDSLEKVLAAHVPTRPVLVSLTPRPSLTPDAAGIDRLIGGPGAEVLVAGCTRRE